ncbi:unnamed protein product [Didymodactylos carnosus]|uniref:Uncharacterized protein n=1 Tax=Didymodactylos carnosus TaxID=1234261 RepID=A0A813ZA93_9BILA|nr:unnamed protein product [Didymodactylos carnosus]CAF0896517.1 unnamed protein product [Didymodactylos carnosus]CAF3500873.1 unnamed protein product [Didymodactylos carnosus]CAF3679763.1 unnamed protein product [Didymodactylos carnosus]
MESLFIENSLRRLSLLIAKATLPPSPTPLPSPSPSSVTSKCKRENSTNDLVMKNGNGTYACAMNDVVFLCNPPNEVQRQKHENKNQYELEKSRTNKSLPQVVPNYTNDDDIEEKTSMVKQWITTTTIENDQLKVPFVQTTNHLYPPCAVAISLDRALDMRLSKFNQTTNDGHRKKYSSKIEPLLIELSNDRLRSYLRRLENDPSLKEFIQPI